MIKQFSFWGEIYLEVRYWKVLTVIFFFLTPSSCRFTKNLKSPTKSERKIKRAKAHSIGLSTLPYFDTLQGRSSPNVPNWDLTSAGAEQILASWVALGPVIYLHPIEPLSSPLLPQPRTPQGVREPAWTLHTDGWRRLSFPSLTSTSKFLQQ